MTELLPRDLWAGGEAWSVSHALGHTIASDLAMLAASDLFDGAFYLRAYPDVAAHGIDPATHFIGQGWREGRRPSLYFDPVWYRAANSDVARAGVNPVLHYISAGEAEGRAPSEYFDLAWYAAQHTADGERTLLAHFMLLRTTGAVSPVPEFDAAFYLAEYPDVAAAGVDPFEHYLLYGYREGRNPSAGFDTRFYLHRYLDGDLGLNPLVHYRRHRESLRLHTMPPPGESDVFEEVRRFSRPGADFETVQPLPRSARRRAQVLAFYLPQFHPIAENDAWWGEGFTEWTAIGRAMPRFAGHYQPRIPRDLGHYRLGDTAEGRAVMRRQAEMARAAGLAGFVHYFYWFNGRRLLEGPLDAWRGDGSIDFPFCLMWANENWTRRWDGSDHEVLISQDYDAADDAGLIDCFAGYFADPRYIRIAGRPLLMVYRAADIPDTAATLARWRGLFAARHREAPLLVMAQSFDALDPRDFGFDAAVEFPPHKLAVGLERRNAGLRQFDPRMTAHVYDYDDMVAASLGEADGGFGLIRTAVPGWDNDARRQGAGLVLRGATPGKYQAWLAELVRRAAAAPVLGAPLVCVNAWNEWAEGAYLEPDQHFGAAYLNATGRAVTRDEGAGAVRVVLVGHDAFAAGAQHLLHHLLRRMVRAHGVQAEYLLLGGGVLAETYAGSAPGVIAESAAQVAGLAAAWVARGFVSAIVNTSAAAWVVPLLRAAGLRVTLLVHELPGLLAEKGLIEAARAGAMAADTVVFPAAFVRERFVATTGACPADCRIMAQGSYRRIVTAAPARTALRARHGIGAGSIMVLGAGYADLRKGFDLFLQTWRAARRQRADVVFCWIGEIEPAMRLYLAREIATAEATGRFVLAGYQRDVGPWFSAADAFALTSREDPFPTVALEAMVSGLPVVSFEGSGGMPDAVAACDGGVAVAMGDVDAMARALVKRGRAGVADRARLAGVARARFDFAAYARDLLHVAAPGVAAVSVVVPSCNYGRYMAERMASIFAQDHPVAEVLVIDDASADDSVAVALRTAEEWRREIVVETATVNSGSVFRQWRKAAERARGALLWIAEADDAADPALLGALARLLQAQPDMVLAFSDSRSVDGAGAALGGSYRDYYAQAGASGLLQDGMFPARAFVRQYLSERNLILNASAVVWRRAALLAAFERCGAELDALPIAGDWRLYLEALAGSDGSVGFIAAPLNVHRRHEASVSAAGRGRLHVEQIGRMHRAVRGLLGPDAALKRRQGAYLRAVARDLGG